MNNQREVYCEFRALTQKLADFKKKHNLTYQQIADAIGVDKSHVHRVIKMETSPSLKFLLRLARFMQLPLFSLFIPTEEIINQSISNQIYDGLERKNMTFDQFMKSLDIPILRLMDITKGNITPTAEEYNAIAKVLDLKENDWIGASETKLNMVKSTLMDLGLKDDQIENVLDYITNAKV